MLEQRPPDRDSLQNFGTPIFSVTNTLLVLNAAVFLVQISGAGPASIRAFDRYFALSLEGLRQGYFWQLISFQFLHGGFLHLLINSWGIYVFGPPVEFAVGRGRFGLLYLLSGLGGGGVYLLGGLLLPIHWGMITIGSATANVPVVGASAGLFGLIAAFATLFPRQQLKVLLFFVVPITVTARVLLGVSAGTGVLGLFLTGSRVAHGAHLGGMLMGYVFMRCARICRAPN